MTTEILGLDELSPSQSSKEVTHNTALRQLEGRGVRALDKDRTTPPVSVVNGDCYIVATGASGAWTGQDKKIAHFFGGTWKYWMPIEGVSLWVNDEDKQYVFDGTNWTLMPGGPMADGDYGDIVVSGSGAVLTIDNDAVSYAKMQNVSATDKLLGRSTAGAGNVEEIACTAAGRALLDDADAAAQRATLGLGTVATLASDTDGTMAANSNDRVPTQAAIVTYVDSRITGGASDVMVFKGVIDASANPNYPAADAGHLYKISVAGKIGGASGPNVEAGDTVYCITDASAAGNHATVGANWAITQVNLDGAVIGPASATDGHVVLFDGTTGKLIKTSGLTLAGTNTGDETTTTAGALINGATGKTTPVDADYIGLMDSAASNVLKKLSWANLKATLKTYFDTLYAPINPKVCLAIACSDETTAVTSGTNKAKFINPYSTVFNVTAVVASLSTAQASGSIFTVDINEAGASILSTKLTIDNTETNSSTAATAAVISDASIAAYAEIEVDVDQVGDGTAKGLKIYVVGYPS
jgi:hypothetical protein